MKDDNIGIYKGLIETTPFGTLVNYLHHPNSPIRYLLHVKEPELLPRLAAGVDKAMASGLPEAVERVLAPLLREGVVKISGREPMRLPFPGAELAAESIDRTSPCQVIYSPPFYLAHTPGLFDGMHLRPDYARGSAEQQQEAMEKHKAVTREQAQRKGHFMTH